MPEIMMIVLAVASGGAVGGTARYIVSTAVGRRFKHAAWGTLAVNVSGSLLLGILAALVDADHALWPLFAVGMLGSYTTVSSFSLQTLMLLEGGRPGLAAVNVAGSVLVCAGSVALGFLLVAGVPG